MYASRIAVLTTAVLKSVSARKNEILSREVQEDMGIVWRGNFSESHDKLLLSMEDMPADFTWCNKDGVNYCTMSRNQHIPQYCGSCWAHGAVSALGDRIKIARKAHGIDINLAVQHMLNCGGIGSCHGGSIDGPYQWLERISRKGNGVSYFTSQPYLACSGENNEGICKGGKFGSCSAENVARTCGTFGEACVGLNHYPNVTISDYGSISGKNAMQKEILADGSTREVTSGKTRFARKHIFAAVSPAAESESDSPETTPEDTSENESSTPIPKPAPENADVAPSNVEASETSQGPKPTKAYQPLRSTFAR